MSAHTIYCSACDREVQVLNLTGPPLHLAGLAIPPADGAVCLSHGALCTGTMCPLFDVPRTVMADRLATVRSSPNRVAAPPEVSHAIREDGVLRDL